MRKHGNAMICWENDQCPGCYPDRAFLARVRSIRVWLGSHWIMLALVWIMAIGVMSLVINFVRHGAPGVGNRCEICREECAELGRKLGADTAYYGRCWVKGWSEGNTP